MRLPRDRRLRPQTLHLEARTRCCPQAEERGLRRHPRPQRLDRRLPASATVREETSVGSDSQPFHFL